MKAELCVFALMSIVLPAAELASAREGSLGVANQEPKGARLAVNEAAAPQTGRVSGMAGERVRLGLAPQVSGARFVRIRGLPADMKMSQGFRVGNAWVAPSTDLGKLELIPSPGFEGTFTLEILYYRDLQQGIAAQTQLAIEFRSEAPAPPELDHDQTPTAAIANPERIVPRERQDTAQTISAEQERRSLDKGANLMKAGDIAAARLLFEELARKSSAKGARALAETFDPKILGGVLIAGLHPDIEAAKKWYRWAAELGDREAAARVVALGAP